jgi:hypothetical protein
VTPSFPASTGYLRDCASSVDGGVGSRDIRQSAKVGPLAFVWVRGAEQAPAAFFRRRPGGYPSGKYLVLVRSAEQVTVSVPPSERKVVALVYDPAHFAPFLPVSKGERVVTFRACAGSSSAWEASTQFNGGIVVAGARCVVLDVRPASANRARRLRMPVGRGTHC